MLTKEEILNAKKAAMTELRELRDNLNTIATNQRVILAGELKGNKSLDQLTDWIHQIAIHEAMSDVVGNLISNLDFEAERVDDPTGKDFLAIFYDELNDAERQLQVPLERRKPYLKEPKEIEKALYVAGQNAIKTMMKGLWSMHFNAKKALGYAQNA